MAVSQGNLPGLFAIVLTPFAAQVSDSDHLRSTADAGGTWSLYQQSWQS